MPVLNKQTRMAIAYSKPSYKAIEYNHVGVLKLQQAFHTSEMAQSALYSTDTVIRDLLCKAKPWANPVDNRVL